MTKILFQKNYTRDNTLLIQQLWFEALSTTLGDTINIAKPSSLTTVDYINDGVIEIWENKEALRFIKTELVKKSLENPSFLVRYLKDYEKKLKTLWNQLFFSTKRELLDFIEEIQTLMPGNVILTYLAEEQKAQPAVKALAVKLRSKDEFFASTDNVFRKSFQKIIPEYGEYIICLRMEEIKTKLPSVSE